MAFTRQMRANGDEAVGGNEGLVYIILPDKRRLILASLLTLDATIKYSVTKVPFLGLRFKVSKKGLGELDGSIKMHYNVSTFREAAKAYKDSGKDNKYELLVVNDDETSAVGRQSVSLKGVTFTELTLAKIDAEADYLTEDMPFMYDDFDLVNVFNEAGFANA